MSAQEAPRGDAATERAGRAPPPPPHDSRVRALEALPGTVGPVLALAGGGLAVAVDPRIGSHRAAVACDLDPGFGIRFYRTGLTEEALSRNAGFLADDLARTIPAGEQSQGLVRIDVPRLHRVLRHGARWVVHQGIGTRADLDVTVHGGAMPEADPEAIPLDLRRAHLDEVGTLGSGEAGIDLLVAESLDPASGARWQIREGEILLRVRCGARSLGRMFLRRCGAAGESPLASREGVRFLGGLAAATNLALANRQIVGTLAQRSLARCIRGAHLVPLCDLVADQVEEGGERGGTRLLIHRRAAYRLLDSPTTLSAGVGATAALLASPRTPLELPIPAAVDRRVPAPETGSLWSAREVEREMASRGVMLRYASPATLESEAPWAFSDPEPTERSLEEAGLVTRVGRLRPLLAIRG